MSITEHEKQDSLIYIALEKPTQEKSTIELLFTGIRGSLMSLFWLTVTPILLFALIFLIIACLRLRISGENYRSNFWKDLYDRREVC